MNIIILASLLISATVSATQPPQPQQQTQPLGFSQSVTQAKNELKSFFANERPVKDSSSNIEDYYTDSFEKPRTDLKPKRKLRKPCKVLPDPEPGLVNSRMVKLDELYVPLRPDEKFYGKFAAPFKAGTGSELGTAGFAYGGPDGPKISNDTNRGGSIPPMMDNFAQPGQAKVIHVPVIMTQRITVLPTSTVTDDSDSEESSSMTLHAMTVTATPLALLSSLQAMSMSLAVQQMAMSVMQLDAHYASVSASLAAKTATTSDDNKWDHRW